MINYNAIVQPFAGGIRITVRARPGTSKARVLRIVDVGEGKSALEVTVAAAAQDGKANRSIEEALARALGVKKKDVTIKAGQTGRIKIVEIVGAADELRTRLEKILDGSDDA